MTNNDSLLSSPGQKGTLLQVARGGTAYKGKLTFTYLAGTLTITTTDTTSDNIQISPGSSAGLINLSNIFQIRNGSSLSCVLQSQVAGATGLVINVASGSTAAPFITMNHGTFANSVYDFQTVASAVNGIIFTSAATAGTPSITSGGSSSDTNINLSLGAKGTGNVTVDTGNVNITTIGKGIGIKTGSNAKTGTGTLVAGAAIISTTAVTAASLVIIQDQGGGILANIGALYEVKASRVAGTSFAVASSNALDNSNFGWIILEQIP